MRAVRTGKRSVDALRSPRFPRGEATRTLCGRQTDRSVAAIWRPCGALARRKSARRQLTLILIAAGRRCKQRGANNSHAPPWRSEGKNRHNPRVRDESLYLHELPISTKIGPSFASCVAQSLDAEVPSTTMKVNLVAWAVVASWPDAACCDGCRDVASECSSSVGGAVHRFVA